MHLVNVTWYLESVAWLAQFVAIECQLFMFLVLPFSAYPGHILKQQLHQNQKQEWTGSTATRIIQSLKYTVPASAFPQVTFQQGLIF